MPINLEQEETFDGADITEHDILIDDIWKVLRDLPKTRKVATAMDALNKLASKEYLDGLRKEGSK